MNITSTQSISPLSSSSSFGVSVQTQNAPAPAAGASFGDVLQQLATEASDSVKAGESTAIASVHGQASVLQVVDSLMSAERSLQTMIAVRDKVVGAYQDISRMAI